MYRKGAIIRQEPVFGSKQITCIKSRTLRTHLTQTMNLVIGTLPLLQINTVCHLSTQSNGLHLQKCKALQLHVCGLIMSSHFT